MIGCSWWACGTPVLKLHQRNPVCFPFPCASIRAWKAWQHRGCGPCVCTRFCSGPQRVTAHYAGAHCPVLTLLHYTASSQLSCGCWRDTLWLGTFQTQIVSLSSISWKCEGSGRKWCRQILSSYIWKRPPQCSLAGSPEEDETGPKCCCSGSSQRMLWIGGHCCSCLVPHRWSMSGRLPAFVLKMPWKEISPFPKLSYPPDRPCWRMPPTLRYTSQDAVYISIWLIS